MSSRKLRWRKDGSKNIPIEEACWQYLLDHAFITREGEMRASIVMRSKELFMTSLKARIEGRYRFTEEEIHEQSKSTIKR